MPVRPPTSPRTWNWEKNEDKNGGTTKERIVTAINTFNNKIFQKWDDNWNIRFFLFWKPNNGAIKTITSLVETFVGRNIRQFCRFGVKRKLRRFGGSMVKNTCWSYFKVDIPTIKVIFTEFKNLYYPLSRYLTSKLHGSWQSL